MYLRGWYDEVCRHPDPEEFIENDRGKILIDGWVFGPIDEDDIKVPAFSQLRILGPNLMHTHQFIPSAQEPSMLTQLVDDKLLISRLNRIAWRKGTKPRPAAA